MSQDVSDPLTELTGFQRDILVILRKLDNPHGLGIKDVLDDQYEGEIHHGRLYPNLDELVEKGLIEKGTKDRRTNSYELSKRGKRELQADLNWRTA